MKKGKCKGCGAEIYWVKTDNGKNMPIDAQPEKRIVIQEFMGKRSGKFVDTYISHFATCPQAKRFKR